MVRLGFQSAILADLSFDEVITFASDNSFSCVELMCWPLGKADSRYAGVTHIDVASLDDNEINRIKKKLKEKNVSISGLGYYPNALHPDKEKRKIFETIPSKNFGLNYDPSHFLWQMMDYVKPIYEFRDRIFHVHIKDARILRERLDDVGILTTPLQLHTPKLPGLGDIQWGKFFSALYEVGYYGAACIEVEDKSFEGSLETRKTALLLSRNYLRQYITQ